MFNRKRATSNPPRVVKSPPSQAASLAATQAFLAHRASNSNFSNAAAAAALRSHTTSPAPVGQIQTKRMQRRGSASSNGSAPDRPGLLRRTSSGSMTERTFREPSPNRPASSHGPYTRSDEPPPVPALPKNIPLSSTQTSQKAARRAASVEPPQRVSSPPPQLVGGRGVSLDRGPGTSKPNDGGAKARLTSLDSVREMDRPLSRNSVNFSRPMSPQNSPPTSPLPGGRVRSPPPTKSTGVAGIPHGESDGTLGSIQETAAAPVKKKKKVVAKGSAEGSHIAQGTTGGPLQATTPQVTPQRQTSSVSSTPSPHTVTLSSGINELPRPKKKKKKKVTPTAGSQAQNASEAFGSAYPSDTDSVTSERSSTTERPRGYNTRAAGLLMKQPSIVREEREAEEQEEKRLTPKMNGQVTGNVTASTSKSTKPSNIVQKSSQHSRATSQGDAHKSPHRTSLDIPGAGRPQSLSPVRAAHFSSQPEYETPDGTKHQPPARSVSPAKSALKHSPSRGHSPIGGLPAARRAGLAASEASDTASNISDDGSRSAPRKKKSVRVSFDDDSVAIGRAAGPPMSPDSPVIMSPQNKSKPRSWFDLVREKRQEDAGIESEQDSVMKPTPALPSFGSVRRSRDEGPTLESTKDQKPSGKWAQDALRTMDTSSDQVVSGIISQDAASKAKEDGTLSNLKRGPNDPLPPEVTSVEGSGYHSDDEANLFEEQHESENMPLTEDARQQNIASLPASEAALTEMSSESMPSEEFDPSVPSIALQPATPALENSGEEKKGWLGMPGEFPDFAGNVETVPIPSISPVEPYHPEITPATVGLAEPEPEAVAAQHDPSSPHVGGVSEGLRNQIESHSGDESGDTGDSIYSDAAEDPDDLDGDGFGSINAIVESPSLSPISPTASRSPPGSPSLKSSKAKTTKPSPLARNESELSEPALDEGWDRAQAYWSGLSLERRRQLEHAAVPGALEEPVIPNKTMRGPDSVKKKKKVAKKSTAPPGSSNPPLPPWTDKQYRNDVAKPAQPAAPPLKSSMRTSQVANVPEPHMRSSMRNSQVGDTLEPHMRQSMRDAPPPRSSLRNSSQRNSMQPPPPEPRGALQKKNRPVSAVAMVDYNKAPAASAPNHTRATSAGVTPASLTPVLAQPKKAPAKKPQLRRNDSGSSSSFKKERPSTSASGKYTMKRTMRPSSVDSRGPANRASSMSARTSSPAESTGRRPFGSVGPGGGGMRTSMRDSIDSSKPAVQTSHRGSVDSKRPKSPSRFGFGKSSKTKSVDSKPNSRFSSRFGDSSDEDDNRVAPSSRFADSSDDEPAYLTPVRGIPRRIDEGDSTDLEDSSVENLTSTSKPKVNGAKPALNTKPEGLALATGSLRVASGDGPTTAMGSGLHAKKAAEKDKKKRSFFGGLGSKKRDDPSRVCKADIESPARRDTPLERSKTEKMLTTGGPKNERTLGPSSPTADPVVQAERPALGSRTSSAQNSPKSPKLQRRNTPKRLTSANDISWPLPQSPGGTMSASDSRPRTSDGAAVSNGAGRPDIGVRRTTVQGPPPPTAPIVVGKTEKKKRFGMLRKAFGMQN